MYQWKWMHMSDVTENLREIKTRFLFMVKVTNTLGLLLKKERK